MSNVMFLYANQVDGGMIGGGNWSEDLPLTNLQNPKLWRVARSASDDPEDTIIDVTLPETTVVHAVVLGPTNLSTAFQYEVYAFPNDLFDEEEPDYYSGMIEGGTRAEFGSLPWGSPYLYDGYTPYDDPERGAWLIHVIPAGISTTNIRIKIYDEGNPEGFVQAGRLFIGKALKPSLNYAYGNNGLGFENNTRSNKMLDGSEDIERRINPRVFRCAFESIPETEAYGPFYEFMRHVGFDGEVFVIMDPEATGVTLQRTAFLAKPEQMDPIAQTFFQHTGIGFAFKEIIS